MSGSSASPADVGGEAALEASSAYPSGHSLLVNFTSPPGPTHFLIRAPAGSGRIAESASVEAAPMILIFTVFIREFHHRGRTWSSPEESTQERYGIQYPGLSHGLPPLVGVQIPASSLDRFQRKVTRDNGLGAATYTGGSAILA